MDPHIINLPRKVIIGKGILGRAGEVCGELGLREGLVLADETMRAIAGDMIAESLHADLMISGNVNESEVAGFAAGLGKPYGFVLSAGGGRVIDFGKLLAMKLSLPFISVPTAPSHDGIASERVSVKDGVNRYSAKGQPPIAILADIGILSGAPKRLIYSGAADVLSNITAVHDWNLARKRGEYYSGYAASLALLSADIVMHSARMIRDGEERGMRDLVEALISSGISMSLAGTSRPASGSEHLISHALDILGSNGLHGEQCGVASIISSYLQGQDWKAMRDALRSIGAPVTIKEIGISQDMFIDAIVRAKDVRKRYTILDEKLLDARGALDACRMTGVCPE